MKSKVKPTFNKLVIDESISKIQLQAFQQWLEKTGISYQQLYFIAEHHRGMPDSRILKTVMKKNDAILSADRPFHNRLLLENFASYYIDDALEISQRSLQGIRPALLPTTISKVEKQPEMSALHHLILPTSEQSLKKLRTKRRRIRNHFGGYDQLSQLSITVTTQGNLIGIRLHVAGSSTTGIMASESFITEPDSNTGTAALCLAMIFSLQLMLQRLAITLYYDPATIPDPYSLSDPLFQRLNIEFPNMKCIATSKGRFMVSLWQKLTALNTSKTNEIVESTLARFKQVVLNTQTEDILTTHSVMPSPNTDRGALLHAAKWFFDQAIKLEIITRISLTGSICTEKKHPKDIDILITVITGSDITPIAKLKRQMSGRIKRSLLGADIFIMEEDGRYLGRPCSYREPKLRVACASDGLRCNFTRSFLCDTSNTIILKNEILINPPIILFPTLQAHTKIPDDVKLVFGLQ